MRDGERRHRAGDAAQNARKAGDGFPGTSTPDQHRRQEQRDEEQEVIEAGGDVLDAVADETAELRERRQIADRERLAAS